MKKIIILLLLICLSLYALDLSTLRSVNSVIKQINTDETLTSTTKHNLIKDINTKDSKELTTFHEMLIDLTTEINPYEFGTSETDNFNLIKFDYTFGISDTDSFEFIDDGFGVAEFGTGDFGL